MLLAVYAVKLRRLNKNTLGSTGLWRLLSEHYSLLSILVGSALFTFTVRPYYNYDTYVEFEAASGVLKWGMLYMQTIGNMINQLGSNITNT